MTPEKQAVIDAAIRWQQGWSDDSLYGSVDRHILIREREEALLYAVLRLSGRNSDQV